MDYILLEDFFANYSLPVIVIAVIVGVVKLLLEKFCDLKMPKFVCAYMPFLLCIILYSVFDMAFVLKKFAFTAHALYAGLLSGSLSVVICSTLKKIISGKPIITNQTILLIEGLIHGFISDNCISATAVKLEQIFDQDYSDELLTNHVVNTLKENAQPIFSEDDLLHLSLLVTQAVKTLKKQFNK